MKLVRAAIYVRCSTVHQNLEVQFNDLRKYADARGYKVVQEFQDFGVSGTKDRRPGLDEMMLSARKRRFDAVLVWRLDRLGRNSRHLLTLFEELEGLQISLVSHQEGVDLSSSIGRVVATVLAALATFERELTRERVIAGIQNAKSKGRTLGRPRSVNTEAIKILRSQGKTYRQISDELLVSAGSIREVLKKSV